MQTDAPTTLELPLTLVTNDGWDNRWMLYLSSTFWSGFSVEQLGVDNVLYLSSVE